MPTTASVLFSGRHLVPLKDPGGARRDVIHLVNGTYAKGEVVGEVTASPGTYKKYLTGNSDGSENPTHILEYDCIFAAGVGYIGDTTNGEWRAPELGVPAYRNGLFDTAELVGMDAGAVTKLNARLTKGDLTAGQLLIPG